MGRVLGFEMSALFGNDACRDRALSTKIIWFTDVCGRIRQRLFVKVDVDVVVNAPDDDVRKRVVGIIVNHLGCEEGDVVDEARLACDLGADSLDVVELAMQFEEEFGISISDVQAAKTQTVKDILVFVKNNIE